MLFLIWDLAMFYITVVTESTQASVKLYRYNVKLESPSWNLTQYEIIIN